MAGWRCTGTPRRVRVEAGSRLHAGFHSVRPHSYWGTAGFYSVEPRVSVEAWRCGDPRLEGEPGGYEQLWKRVMEALGWPQACAEVLEAPPRHHGLGSTTQAGLALAQAVLAAARGDPGDPLELARLLGRARNSGAGTLLYLHGGFAADAGVPDPEGPRLLLHKKIPVEWRLVVLIPRLPGGPPEEGEERLIPPVAPTGTVASMARGLLDIAIGLERRDLQITLEGLWRMQVATGLMFRGLQGGLFRSDLSRLVEEARMHGVTLAQSSWGPTLYTITTRREAASTARLVHRAAKDLGLDVEVLVASPRNTGATVYVRE